MKLLLWYYLLYTVTPPAPSRPTIVDVKANTVTIEWSQSVCNGGHTPESYTIRYRRSSYRSYSYIRQITQKRYKITGLSYSTSYLFWVQTTTVDSRTSSYSSLATISTLPRGKLPIMITITYQYLPLPPPPPSLSCNKLHGLY